MSAISELQCRYRAGNFVPFCLNPSAAYLMEHTTIIGHQKKVNRTLGRNVFYINNRNHFKSLELHLAARMDKQIELEHQTRYVAELQKERRFSKSNIDRIFPMLEGSKADWSTMDKGAMKRWSPKYAKSNDLISKDSRLESETQVNIYVKQFLIPFILGLDRLHCSKYI